jgi:hypothetical protein
MLTSSVEDQGPMLGSQFGAFLLPIFGGKNGVFLKKQTSVVHAKFSPNFWA